MVCPNHGTEQAQTGTVSDGVYIRPVLACGCTPTWEETGLTPVSAALTPEPVQVGTLEAADPEAFGKSHLGIAVEHILRAKGLIE